MKWQRKCEFFLLFLVKRGVWLWLRCHGDFIFGVGESVLAYGVVGEVDAIEGLGEGFEGLLAAVGF